MTTWSPRRRCGSRCILCAAVVGLAGCNAPRDAPPSPTVRAFGDNKCAQSDRLLLIAMKESKVGRFDETVVYQGVDGGGQGSWGTDAREREAGLPRVVPEQYLRPADPNVSWPDDRAFLVREGVKDPPFTLSPRVCT